jgi:hypothetical protein
MKSSRIVVFLAVLTVSFASARGGFTSEPHPAFAQLEEIPRPREGREAAAFVAGEVRGEQLQQVQAESGQVPVTEAVDQPDSPAMDAAQGDAEAQLPAGGPAASDAEQPAVGGQPDVEQPSD